MYARKYSDKSIKHKLGSQNEQLKKKKTDKKKAKKLSIKMWASSDKLNPLWLNEHGIACSSCEVEKDLSNATAPRSCFLLKIDVAPFRLVLKQLASDASGTPLPDRVALSKRLGLAREAIFYRELKDSLSDLPLVYYADGDLETGSKVIFMEDLSSWVDSGSLFLV